MLVRNEDKRTKIWGVLMAVSSVIVVALVIFVLYRMFTVNPLQGEWVSSDGALTLQMQKSLSAKAELKTDDVQEALQLKYTLDRTEKKVSFHPSGEQAENSRLQNLTTTFYYSVDSGTMTLTNPDSGQEYLYESK